MAETKKPAAAAAPKNTPAKPPSMTSAYLFIYNFASSVAWSTVLGRTLVYGAADGFEAVYPGVGKFARLTQTMACLEVLHSLFGRFCCFILARMAPFPSHHHFKKRSGRMGEDTAGKRKDTEDGMRLEANTRRRRPRPPHHDSHANRLAHTPRLGRHLPLPEPCL